MANVVADLLQKHNRERPDKPYVVTTEGITMTYGETYQRSLDWARRLHRWGVAKGDRVILAIDTRPEFCTVYYGCHMIGAVPVPFNPGLPDHSTKSILDMIKPTICVRGTETDRDRVARLMAAENIPVADLPRGFDEAVAEDQLPDKNREPFAIADRETGEPSHIIWSSGTTGRPKGAAMPMSWAEGGQAINAMIGATEDDRFMTPLPLFHGFGVLFHMLALHAGAGVVLPPRFSASRFWQQAIDHKATIMQHVGVIISFLLKQPAGELDRRHSIRVTFGGGAPKDLWVPFEERFGVEIIEGWAATEFGIGTLNPPGGKKGSIGKASPQVEIRIVDDEFNDLPDNAVGQALVRPAGAVAFEPSYYGDPEATRASIHDGWFKTGDLLSRDPEGWYYFHGRTKDSLRRRGENIVPEDLESYLEGIDGVEDVAAVAVPSEDGDDDIKLCVVYRDEVTDERARALWDDIVSRLPRSMTPRYLDFHESLPYTPTHKLQRVKLRRTHRRVWDGRLGRWIELTKTAAESA